MTANIYALVLCSLVLVGASELRAAPEKALILGCRETSVTRLRIGINTTVAISPVLTAEIRRVVDEVWGPYGLRVAWSAASISAIPSDADVVMLVQLEPIVSVPTALGAVIFGPDGPAPLIRLSASTAIRWIRQSRYPSLNGQQLLRIDQVAGAIGALLGQAAAHELGHLLLSTKAHAQTGLMAHRYTVDPFLTDSTRARLDSFNERRLMELLGLGLRCSTAGVAAPGKFSPVPRP